MFLTGTKKMLGDRIFLQKAVRIALPVAMQGMLNTIRKPGGYHDDRDAGRNDHRGGGPGK